MFDLVIMTNDILIINPLNYTNSHENTKKVA